MFLFFSFLFLPFCPTKNCVNGTNVKYMYYLWQAEQINNQFTRNIQTIHSYTTYDPSLFTLSIYNALVSTNSHEYSELAFSLAWSVYTAYVSLFYPFICPHVCSTLAHTIEWNVFSMIETLTTPILIPVCDEFRIW